MEDVQLAQRISKAEVEDTTEEEMVMVYEDIDEENFNAIQTVLASVTDSNERKKPVVRDHPREMTDLVELDSDDDDGPVVSKPGKKLMKTKKPNLIEDQIDAEDNEDDMAGVEDMAEYEFPHIYEGDLFNESGEPIMSCLVTDTEIYDIIADLENSSLD